MGGERLVGAAEYRGIYLRANSQIRDRRSGVSPTGKSFCFVRRVRAHRLPSEIRAQNRDRARSLFPFAVGCLPFYFGGVQWFQMSSNGF